MSYELINRVKGDSIIRCTGAATVTINLTDLHANTNVENTILSATITDVAWSTNGSITISRGTENIFSLYNSGQWTNMEGNAPRAGANGSGNSIVITIASGGCVVVGVRKQATYNVDFGRALT